jgi:hypothetical protein
MPFVALLNIIILAIKNEYLLGMVVEASNPRYAGGRDWENHSLRSVQAKHS